MPYTTLVSGTTITSSWANENVRDQVVTPFASSAARSSAITSPVAGMATYITSNDSSEGVETYNSAGEWRLPWNMQWGEVAYDELASDSSIATGTAAAISGMAVTFTSVANRKYRIDVSMPLTTGANSQTLQFDVFSTTSSGIIKALAGNILVANDVQAYHAHARVTSPAAGSNTWVVRGLASDTGAVVKGANADATFTVTDVGPAGAPS